MVKPQPYACNPDFLRWVSVNFGGAAQQWTCVAGGRLVLSAANDGEGGSPVEPEPKEDGMAGMKEFANLFYREGALDPKTAQLVAMAAMSAAGCTS
jgi:hypothetical protein